MFLFFFKKNTVSAASPGAAAVDGEHPDSVTFDRIRVADQGQGFSQGAQKGLVVSVGASLPQEDDGRLLLRMDRQTDLHASTGGSETFTRSFALDPTCHITALQAG